ncbi:unnamed protein product [Dovyalis caffra]|uniref:AMP-activated protein kinase glycogen-binding domain-containing protein n=1 Tax=Dovyalis caffra TaxID=77055 RepID=A0AAV1S0L5_9ROSI|nr:unnamed protein product [Dovyalis caffra]
MLNFPFPLLTTGTFSMEIGTARCCIGKQVPWFSWNSRTLDGESIHKLPYDVVGCIIKPNNPRLAHSHQGFVRKKWMSNVLWRTYTMPFSLEESSSVQPEDYSVDEENTSEDSPEEPLDQPLSSDELNALLLDSQREKLTKKLSEANQQNRFLKRQLHVTEGALVNFKSELAAIELEIQGLVMLAEEIAQYEIPEGSRKIKGKYIQSHLLSCLGALQRKLKQQTKDVEAVQSKEVSLLWCGMAESVQVMGTFDGWSQGEHLSPEYDGSFTKFATTLMLRPGRCDSIDQLPRFYSVIRYEIKFLVDGEWQLSPEYPTVGEGLTENNLLIVE